MVLPATVTIHEIRMTVGHTGKGPKGEDYFAMNHRIKKVSVLVGGEVINTFTLDPEVRTLQTLKVTAPGGTLRIRVDEVVPGSKTSWREVCVSELEVWGTPPTGWTPPAKPFQPTVDVAPPPPSTSLDKLCSYLPAALKANKQALKEHDKACKYEHSEEARAACLGEPPGSPACSAEAMDITSIAPPWKGLAMQCTSDDDIWDGEMCNIVVSVGNQLVTGPRFQAADPHAGLRGAFFQEAVLKDIITGGAAELVVRYGIKPPGFMAGDYEDKREFVVVCRAAPPSCSDQLQVADNDWTADIKFDKGEAVITAQQGTPPAQAVGKKPLVFK
jgi:hypothetical protein